MFKFKGISSTDMQVIIEEEEHFLARAPQRYEVTEIEGRDGAIFDELGYSYIERPIYVQCLNVDKIDDILAWLNGEGEFEYKGRVTTARFYSQLEPTRNACIRIIDANFIRNPFWDKAEDEYQVVKPEETYVTAEGTDIKIQDSADWYAKIKIKGKTEQETRSGKNLLNVTATSKTQNGITFTINADKSVTINGTNSLKDTIYFRIADDLTLPAGNYTLYNKNLNVSNENSFIFYDDGLSFPRKNISNATLQAETIIKPYIKVISGATINNQTIYPMIVQGTYTEDTIGEYEPYGASPSPEFPSEIENVEGKNLFDGKVMKGIYNSDSGAFVANDNYLANVNIITVKPNTSYVFSSDLGYSFEAYMYRKDKTYIGRAMASNNKFTTSSETCYINWRTLTSGQNNLECKIQIEKGTVTEYVPYNSLAVKVTGKNLLPYPYVHTTRTFNGITFTDNGDGTITANGTATADTYFTLQINKDYGETIDGRTYGTNGTYAIPMTSADTVFMYYNKTNKTVSLNVSSGVTINNVVFKPQIVLGTEVGEWKPYKEQTVYFPLAEGQKLIEGTKTEDYGWHNKRKQFTVDTSKITIINHYQNIAYAAIPKPTDFIGYDNFDNCELYSNKAKTKKVVAWDDSSNINHIFSSASKISLWIGFPYGTTLEEMKTALEGTIIEYELVKEGIVPYTEEQQEAWDKIQSLRTYKTTTNIISDAPAEVTYKKYLYYAIQNTGNIKSRPILKISKLNDEVIDIKINNVRFSYDFNGEEYVIIDCEEKEVKYEGLNRNRQIKIGYEFPVCNVGNNEILMYSGDCIVEAKRKDRWL